MKNTGSFVIAFLFSLLVAAQVPQGFNYQAVIRDGAGEITANTAVNIRFSFHQTTAGGVVVYQETHSPVTNEYGLVNLVMGQGTVNSGTFASINWKDFLNFLQVEVNTGLGFVDTGTAQFLGTPYAMVSTEATDVQLDELTDVNTAGASNGQVLKWNGSAWTPSTDLNTTYTAGAGINVVGTVISNTGDTNTADDLITSTAFGGDVSGTYNNLQLATNSVGASEIATDAVGSSEIISDAVGSAEIVAGAVGASEINQMGAINGQVLEWNGSTWIPSMDDNTTYSAGMGMALAGTVFNNTGDISAGDDVTTSSPFGGDVTGTYNNLQLVANSIGAPEIANDAIGSSEIVAGAVGASELNQMGATNGQVMKWNGTMWVASSDNSGSADWAQTGNAGTVDGNNFIGTTDNVALSFRVNNIKSGRIDMNGNTILGYESGSNTMGTNNTAIGSHGLQFNVSGTDNTSCGSNALNQNSTGINNSAIGSGALQLNSTGTNNTATGCAALNSNHIGSFNTANGSLSMVSNNGGTENTAIGYATMNSNSTGSYNTASGTSALQFNVNGNENSAHGYRALGSNTSGNHNVANGSGALRLNSVGNQNTANGFQSLWNNNASWNTASGAYSLFTNFTGICNSAFGVKALFSNSGGSFNTASGYSVMEHNIGGGDNTAYGSHALQFNTYGNYNVAVGSHSLNANIDGVANAACGIFSLSSNTTGGYNTAMGAYSLENSISGNENTAVGVSALFNSAGGNFCTAVGRLALANSNTNLNTAVGYNSAYGTTSGFQNTAIGANSMVTNVTGSWNTALGINTGPNSSALSNTTCIGTDATATATDMVRVGNVFVNSIGGQVGWSTLSDGRFKTDVNENVPGSEFITALTPVTYRVNRSSISAFTGTTPSMEGDNLSELTTGFIAQDVERAAKEIGFDFSGVDAPKSDADMYGLRYAEFVVPLVKAVQEQQQQIEELKSANKLLQETLETKIADLQNQMNASGNQANKHN